MCFEIPLTITLLYPRTHQHLHLLRPRTKTPPLQLHLGPKLLGRQLLRQRRLQLPHFILQRDDVRDEHDLLQLVQLLGGEREEG